MYKGPGVTRMWCDAESGADQVAGGQRDKVGNQGPGPGRALQTISGLWSFAFKSNWESPKCFFLFGFVSIFAHSNKVSFMFWKGHFSFSGRNKLKRVCCV